MKYTYIIVDDSEKTELETRKVMQRFPDFVHLQSAFNFQDALNAILKFKPHLVFLEIAPEESASKLSLYLISEVHRFLAIMPRFIITTKNESLALDAITYDVFDYWIKPLELNDLRKSLLKFEKSNGHELMEDFSDCFLDVILENPNTEVIFEDIGTAKNAGNVDLNEDFNVCNKLEVANHERPLIICIKSYGDHKYIEASSVWYLKADNNSTDIYLKNGEVITAFKTLKNFENILPFPFLRIHNSFIINVMQVTRIHVGNSLCYIRDTSVKIPFSKSYKNNIDKVIRYFEDGNYVEF